MAISAHADIQADARKIQETHQDAVVYLKAVLEIDRGGQKRESSLETLGTFISDSGLIVTANSNLGQTPNSEGNAPTLQDLKVLMPDGAELPGTLVMQDTDLDLAFIKVSREGDAGSFPNVTLQEQGPKFELFDQYVT
ncbi:MAG: trypsin-like peptidase domain-containing protein, partial [Verrucomicrobiales bacterium]